MSVKKIQDVLDAFAAAGISACRCYPGQLQPEIDSPMAVVGVHKLTAKETVLSVQLFSSTEQGGGACEDAAVAAVQVLLELGAECTQEGCKYDRTADRFYVQLLALWKTVQPAGPETPNAVGCRVSIDGVELPYLTGFSAEQTAKMQQVKALSVGTVELRCEDPYWTLTVEELLPLELAPQAPEPFHFSLTVSRSGYTESYTQCCWKTVLREDTPQGVRQVRIGCTWAERSLGSE